MVPIFCLLHLFIILSSYSYSSIVGPRNWLTKLTPAELAQVREQCSPKQSNVQISNRIVGGEPAKPGEFKFAAVFTYPPPYPAQTRCGATLISPRHLITARHCFESDMLHYKLWIAGVCHIPGTDYECQVPQIPDMVSVNYEFALFDAEYNRRFVYLDFAIIQLVEPIPESLFQRVQIACLPNKLDEDPPREITLVGSGLKDGNQSTDLLHHITLPTDIDCSVDGSSFCAMATEVAPLASAGGGDSGSAGVSYSDDIKKHVIHGVISTGTINSMPKMETPFRKISDLASKLFADKCQMSNALKEPKSDICALSTEWAVAIVASTDDEDKLLCDGVLVTDQHILTTRECILRHFKELENQIEDSVILIMQRDCMSDNCQSWSAESIAWSYSHPLAIVQLQATQLLPVIQPACFSNSNTDNNKMFRGFGRQLKKVKEFNDDHTKAPYALKDICDENEYVCAKYTETCDSGTTEGNDGTHFGAGIVGVDSGSLVGLRMQKRASQNDTTIELYWRTHKISNALYGIMNLRYDSGTLVVPICWFFVIERKSAGTLMVVQRKSKLLVYWPDWCSLFVPKDVLRLCDLSVHPVSKNDFTRAESNLHRQAGAFGIGHDHGDCDIPIL
ncbi:trypsin domain-containing protein [Ditylenchus destructor]|uniref:Trypsin domain-containing protein n=1 Tax=Ditylenchus destructor TaxID=166010 RepID=A0AAD4MZM2_9BILA|nr:trypsin domain-containing protein [Ditylenchus destructor]